MTSPAPVATSTTSASAPGTTIGPEQLSRALERTGLRRFGSPPLVVERGWPLPKIPLVLLCSEPDSGESSEPWWSFYLLDSGEMPYTCRAAIRQGRANYLSDLNGVVVRFPDDPLLPEIAGVSIEETALQTLNPVLSTGGEPWSDLSARVLSYKPARRLTLEFQLGRTDGEKRTLYVKLFPEGTDKTIVEVQRSLESALAGRAFAGVGLAPLIGRVPAWNGLLWERVADPSLLEVLPTSGADEAVRQAARALCALHGSGAQWRTRHDRSRELGTIGSWAAAIARFDSELADRVQGNLRRLEDRMEMNDSVRLVPAHRDFYDKQVLVGPTHATLLDLEFACLAEAELDIGNFLAHLTLRELQGWIDNAGHLARVFTTMYRHGMEATDWQMVGWYRAASLLRLACVYSLRDGCSGLGRRLVTASDEALEGESLLEMSR